MIDEAYHTPDTLHMHPDLDGHGNEQCTGIGGTGSWEWWVVRAGKPINGKRYAAPHQGIGRILLAPEKDGKRVCTVVPSRHPVMRRRTTARSRSRSGLIRARRPWPAVRPPETRPSETGQTGPPTLTSRCPDWLPSPCHAPEPIANLYLDRFRRVRPDGVICGSWRPHPLSRTS